MHIDEIILAVPIVLGLVGVGLAVAERGYKRYLDAKRENPALTFDSSYLINILISSGGMSAIIAGVIPTLTEQLGEVTTPITVISVIGNFALGYLATYRILDGLNNVTEQKIQQEEEEAATPTKT